MNDVSIVVLTALDLEYEAVRAHLTDVRTHTHPAGTRYETGCLKGGRRRVALGLVGAGNQPAAVLAERAITRFAPRALIFVGVAGGLREHVRLGDVVVASRVYAYHGATSQDDGLMARPRAWDISHEPDQIAHGIARSKTWLGSLPADAAEPMVHFGPIAAGEVVQDSAVSAQARWIKTIYNDAVAIEMEGAGVAQAGHFNRSLPVVVVRGISDRADGTKATTDGANWQPRAATNAAAFAAVLAEALACELDDRRTSGPALEQRGSDMGDTTTNTAMGNARVGVQAGRILGPVTVYDGATGASAVTDDFVELRTLLQQARARGDLDDLTFRAAEREIETVEAALPPVTTQGRETALLSLKRLRGLLLDVTDLATKVAVIIAAVQSTS